MNTLGSFGLDRSKGERHDLMQTHQPHFGEILGSLNQVVQHEQYKRGR